MLLLASKAPAGFVLSGQGVQLLAVFSAHARLRPAAMIDQTPERRRDTDGAAYTKKEFKEYYGNDTWEANWNYSKPAHNVTLLGDLNVGDMFQEAIVLRYTATTVIVDIGAEVPGVCHFSRIPADVWEFLDRGHCLPVTIEKIDRAKREIDLTTREPRDDIKLLSELKVGDVFEEATVMGWRNFGAFMDIGAEKEALCPVSKIPPHVWKTLDYGHTLKVSIENINVAKGKIDVSAMVRGKGGRGKSGGRGVYE